MVADVPPTLCDFCKHRTPESNSVLCNTCYADIFHILQSWNAYTLRITAVMDMPQPVVKHKTAKGNLA